MSAVLDNNVLQRIFEEFPELDTIWVQGDLASFYDAWLIVPDNVSAEKVMGFIDYNLDTAPDTEGTTVVFNEGEMRSIDVLNDDFVECKREDYI